MYKIIKLIIKLKNKNSHEQMIYDFLELLYRNGQILKEYMLYKDNDFYIAIVNTNDLNSFDKNNFNLYINQMLEDIEISYEYMSDSIIYNETCECDNPSWYMLYSDYQQEESPLRCGDCALEVPLYKIPKINGEVDHYQLLKWQSTYKAVDTLWMSTYFDRYSKNQLEHKDSILNKYSFDIRKELEDVVGKKVYLFLRYPARGTFKEKDKVLDTCPICNQKLSESPNLETVDKVCNNCFIAVDDIE